MNYLTKPTSKEHLRECAKIMRIMFHQETTGPFNVLEALEIVGDVFKGSNYIVVEDNELPATTMTRCFQNDLGGYTIEIKQSIYDGAYERRVGAFLGFICHELCHIFLFTIGFTPIYERSLKDSEVEAYRSIEWQAKYLCGEVMIPYEECKKMSMRKIVEKYHCSKAFAKYRIKQRKENKLN